MFTRCEGKWVVVSRLPVGKLAENDMIGVDTALVSPKAAWNKPFPLWAGECLATCSRSVFARPK